MDLRTLQALHSYHNKNSTEITILYYARGLLDLYEHRKVIKLSR